jgi:hypothetical protein
MPMLPRWRITAHAACFAAVVLWCNPAAAQRSITNGAACSTGDASFWEQSYICPSSTDLWQHPAFQFGAAIASCASGTAGMVQWNGSTLQYCNGSSWGAIGAATFPAGSVSAPGWAVTTDTATGLFQATTSTLSISSGGIEAMRFLNTASGVDYLTAKSGATANPATVTVGAGGSDSNISIAQASKGTGVLTFTTNGTEALRITSTGSIGVGTTTPKSSVDLSAKADGLLLQTTSAAAGASCTGYTGAIRYNSAAAVNNIEFCDGTNWRFFAASTTACGTPSGLSFTNVTSATLNTVYTSNAATITFSGCSAGGLSVSVSGASTAQISINGGAWATSGAITSGQTLNVRMTTSGSVSTTLTATVTVGGSSTNWTTTTRPGSLNIFLTPGSYLGSTIGSLGNADANCQAAANAAGYSGTYKAIISNDTTSASSRLTLSYPIVNAYNGSTVAASNLWSGSIANVILNPSGSDSCSGCDWDQHASFGVVWTGTTASGGSATGNNCSGWTSGSGTGVNGCASQTTTAWVNCNSNTCGGTEGLYCIQQ